MLWPADGLGHQRRARTVTELIKKTPGVVEAEANATGPVRIEFDREATSEANLRRALADLGVTVPGDDPPEVAAAEGDDHTGHDHAPGEGHAPEADDHSGHDHAPGAHGGHSHGGIFGERTELIFAILSGVCVGLGWALATFTGVAETIPFVLFLGAYAFGGWFTVREAVDSIRAGRFEIDFLMLVAAAGAAALGEWFEGGLCCCSCSPSATRSRATRWVRPAAPSKRSANWRRRRPAFGVTASRRRCPSASFA